MKVSVQRSPRRQRGPVRITTLMLAAGSLGGLGWLIWHEYTYRATCHGTPEGCDFPELALSHGGADALAGSLSVLVPALVVLAMYLVFSERGVR